MTVTDIRYSGLMGLVVAALICLAGCCSKSSVSDSGRAALIINRRQQEAKPLLALERVSVMVPLGYTNCASTQVLIERNLSSPPPWKDGNSLAFTFWKATIPGQVEERAFWRVVNMHAENYFEITRRLKMSSVEVHVLHTGKSPERVQDVGQPERTLDNGYAVITDARIPREWYRSEPATLDLETARALKAAYPGSFRPSD